MVPYRDVSREAVAESETLPVGLKVERLGGTDLLSPSDRQFICRALAMHAHLTGSGFADTDVEATAAALLRFSAPDAASGSQCGADRPAAARESRELPSPEI